VTTAPHRLELGSKQRRVLLAAELYTRKHGKPPTWSELLAIVGVPRFMLVSVLRGLRARGAVTFDDEMPRSLRVTRAGLRSALNGPCDANPPARSDREGAA
jgi:hypothetical protein